MDEIEKKVIKLRKSLLIVVIILAVGALIGLFIGSKAYPWLLGSALVIGLLHEIFGYFLEEHAKNKKLNNKKNK